MRIPATARLLGALTALLLLAAAACSASESEVAASSGISFTLDDGSIATLQDFEGAPVVLNFFASWCPPCRAELPDFEAVHQATGDDVTFLGINQDLDETTWRSFVAGTTITYQTAFTGSELFDSFGGIGMPTTVFLSADGEVLHTQTGALSKDGLSALIDEHFS